MPISTATLSHKIQGNGWLGARSASGNGPRIPIATKLVLSFLLVIVVPSAIFTGVATVIISDHIRSDLQAQAREDLNGARRIYVNKLAHIKNVVISTADRSGVSDALASGNVHELAGELENIRTRESLDILTITDAQGDILFRASNSDFFGPNRSQHELVNAVQLWQMPAAATSLLAANEMSEGPSRQIEETLVRSAETMLGNNTDIMLLGAAAPVFDGQNLLSGVVYGGILLNTGYDFICEIKKAVFHGPQYEGRDVGFVAIYQKDVAILRCPGIEDGSEAVGSRAAEEAFRRATDEGQPTEVRDFIAGSWYTTVYEPIWSADYKVIGLLQVGRLEQTYLDIRNQIITAFLAITLVGALLSILFSYLISQRISTPLKKLVSASRSVAQGNLDVRVDSGSMSKDELGELADSFNAMATALKERDDELKELTRSKIRRSERLALIGQLSANVAHELNNPLQGIVAYSHLLLERMPPDEPDTSSVQKIVIQANRCREIIRGLLDLSRQREPVKILCDVNAVLRQCISLVENQALFHNIEIAMDLEAGLPLAVIDPSQIERVFMNLIINAAEAMEGGGCLTLESRRDPMAKSIKVIVADTGHGIEEGNLSRIFDPFFTTKEVGHGTGLGLAISYGIVRDHEGTISVESALGKGTVFTVSLPVEAEERVLSNER